MKKIKIYVLAASTFLCAFNIGCFHATGLEQASVIAEMLPEKELISPDRNIGSSPKSTSGDYYLGNDFIHIALAYNSAYNTNDKDFGSIIDAGYLEIDDEESEEDQDNKKSKETQKTTHGRISAPSNAMGYLVPVISNDLGLKLNFNKQFHIERGEDYASLVMHGSVLDTKKNKPIDGVEAIHKVRLGRLDAFVTVMTQIINNSGHTIAINSIGDQLKQKPNKKGYHLCLPDDACKEVEKEITACSNCYKKIITGQKDLLNFVEVPGVGLIDLNYEDNNTNAINANLWILPLDNEELRVSFNSSGDNYPDTLVMSGLPSSDLLLNNATITYNRRIYIIPNNNAKKKSMSCGHLLNTRIGNRSFFDIINSTAHSFIRYGMHHITELSKDEK